MKKVAYIIGRFTIPHLGHISLFNEAVNIADEIVVLVGSAGRARDPKTPFTYHERVQMLHLATQGISVPVKYIPLYDVASNDIWKRQVLDIMHNDINLNDCALISCGKDAETSEYLNWFKDVIGLTIKHVTPVGSYNSTQIRESFYSLSFEAFNYQINDFVTEYIGICPSSVLKFLVDFYNHKTETYRLLCRELVAVHSAIETAKKMPYPVPYLTGDAIVHNTVHNTVLLVTRKKAPGEGLLAIPGGFFNSFDAPNAPIDHEFHSAALREAKEETGINLTADDIKEQKVFAYPTRSLRWRIITCACYIPLHETHMRDLNPCQEETAGAQWYPVTDLLGMRDKFFEDHFMILDYFFNLTKYSR